MLYKKYEQFRTALLIKTAIDNYPEGICFAAANGRPILANRRINELCHLLLGYTITNTNAMWNELECRAIERAEGGQLLLSTPDGKIWQFRCRELSMQNAMVFQYDAADITELYAYRNRIRENNQKVARFQHRQRILLQNIVQNKLDQELLNTKKSW